MAKIPGLNQATTYIKAMAGAATGKAVAHDISSGAKRASGVIANARNSNLAKKTMSYAKSHPYKTAGMGAMGLGAASYVTGRSRRGPGVSKTMGRPTGMYKY